MGSAAVSFAISCHEMDMKAAASLAIAEFRASSSLSSSMRRFAQAASTYDLVDGEGWREVASAAWLDLLGMWIISKPTWESPLFQTK